MATTNNSLSRAYSIRITPDQEKKILKFSSILGIKKKTIGFLGVCNLLEILDTVYNDVAMNDERFKEMFFNPSIWNKGIPIYSIIKNMSFEERMHFNLLIEVTEQNMKGGDANGN